MCMVFAGLSGRRDLPRGLADSPSSSGVSFASEPSFSAFMTRDVSTSSSTEAASVCFGSSSVGVASGLALARFLRTAFFLGLGLSGGSLLSMAISCRAGCPATSSEDADSDVACFSFLVVVFDISGHMTDQNTHPFPKSIAYQWHTPLLQKRNETGWQLAILVPRESLQRAFRIRVTSWE